MSNIDNMKALYVRPKVCLITALSSLSLLAKNSIWLRNSSGVSEDEFWNDYWDYIDEGEL